VGDHEHPRNDKFHFRRDDVMPLAREQCGRWAIIFAFRRQFQIQKERSNVSRATAAAPAPTSRKTVFSDRDREVIRKHARASRIEQRTTGSASARVRVGERLPDSVEIRSFPDEVYRESPTLREYRYIERENRTYVVEPRERTIIEEIE
jgi:Protein of unknown function (DUF1236)